MLIEKTPIKDLLIFTPKVFGDERGYFFEAFSKKTFVENELEYDWVQDNEAFSSKGILRGMHYQVGASAQAKLVRVTQGEVQDVVIDLRPGSSTYGKHFSIILNETNKKQLLVPRSFAHGYLVLSDHAIFAYKCDNFYDKSAEGGVRYDDEAFAIKWLLDNSIIQTAERDASYPDFGKHRAI